MTHQVVETATGRMSVERVGTGVDLVVLHSLLTDRRAFDPVASAWAETHRVNLVDLPGFAESSPVEPDMGAYADAVGSFLAAGGFEPSRTILVGNGLGAFIALGTAVRHGPLFDRLCLVGCGVSFPADARATFAAMAARVEEGGMEAVVDVAVRRIFPERHLAAHPELVEERRRVLVETDPVAFVTACRALQGVDFGEAAGSVTNPTLIVVGSEDGATPPVLAEEAHRLIPDSRLVELPGVGHAPQLQDPAAFREAVDGFLSGDV